MYRQSLLRKFDMQSKKYDNRRKNTNAYNYRFYNRNIELTGLDLSKEMLDIARNVAKDYPFKTTLVQEDVESVVFNPNSFDTIVSSASLCAYQDPVQVLNHFQKWCKPEGKILLLDH